MSEVLDRQLEIPLRRFRPYPSYKASGVEWLGKIPANWDSLPLKRLTTLVSRGDSPTYVDTSEIRVINQACIQLDGLQLRNVKYQEQSDIGSWKGRLQPGDVLMNSTGTGTLGRVQVFREAGLYIADSHVTIVRTRDDFLYPEYVSYLLNTPLYQSHIYAALTAGSTNQIELSREGLRTTPLVVFSIREQELIVLFLTRETERIDALLAKKKRIIDLLHERWSALITRAVTRGLDSTAPMKDSGVEWLGKIPAHWSVKRLWHLTPRDRRIMYGIVLPGPHVDDGVPIVKGGDVSARRLQPSLLSRTAAEIESHYVRSRLRGRDLVYAIRGSIGDVAMVPDELRGANLTQDAARISYTEKTDGSWLLYALRSSSVFAQLEARALGATIRGINIRDLKRALMPVPPKDEQERIATFLVTETREIDQLIDKVSEGVDRLHEFRTALISAAVTGKIDVREEVA